MRWRLVTDYDILFQNEKNLVYFVPVENRKNSKFISNLNLQGISTKTVDLGEIENFSMDSLEARFNDSRNIEIKLGNSWVGVGNYIDNENMGHLLTECTLEKGHFQERFEVAFSDDDACTDIKLVSPEMSEYDDCFDEMTRLASCKSYKKTKKFIPGHRYDSEKETIFFLGTVIAKKAQPYCTNFLSEDKVGVAYLFVNKLPKEAKTVSDVFKLSYFDENDPYAIKYRTNIQSMVDSGEILENDSPRIEDFWETLTTNACDIAKQPLLGSSHINFQYFYRALEPYAFSSISGVKEIPEMLKETLMQYIEVIIKELLIIYYNSDYSLFGGRGLYISEQQTMDANVANTFKLFCKYIMDPNALSYPYYEEFFKYFDIPINDLIIEQIKMFDKSFVTESFDNFIKWWEQYYRYHDIQTSTKKSCQRVKAVGGYGKGKVDQKASKNTIESLFGKTPLSEILKKQVNDARNGDLTAVSSFEVVNLGTKSRPKEYVHLTINVNKVVEYATYNNELTESLKKNILNERFTELELEFDLSAQTIK